MASQLNLADAINGSLSNVTAFLGNIIPVDSISALIGGRNLRWANPLTTTYPQRVTNVVVPDAGRILPNDGQLVAPSPISSVGDPRSVSSAGGYASLSTAFDQPVMGIAPPNTTAITGGSYFGSPQQQSEFLNGLIPLIVIIGGAFLILQVLRK